MYVPNLNTILLKIIAVFMDSLKKKDFCVIYYATLICITILLMCSIAWLLVVYCENFGRFIQVPTKKLLENF